MKRRRLTADSIVPPPSPWRWAIGGPITDFGEDGIEAGPSRAPFAQPELVFDEASDYASICTECDALVAPAHSTTVSTAVERRARRSPSPTSSHGSLQRRPFSSDPPLQHDPLSHDPQPSSHPSIQPQRRLRHRKSHTLTALLALASAFNPLVVAGPVPTPTTTVTVTVTSTSYVSPSHLRPTPTQFQPRRLQVDPEYEIPTTLPQVSTKTVAETILPYYLTQSDDGHWYKVETAWWLYGRVIEPQTDAASATATASPIGSLAVISVLPRGWGVANPRSPFYQTPLIVTAAVILAVIIVSGIIFITIQRRKVARRKKRHDARMRRKALTAAGLTEDEVRNAGEDTERAFKERLEEFERQYQLKKRAKAKHHQVMFVRTKVRVWHKGMRKRKGGLSNNHVDEKPEADGFTSAHVLGGGRPRSQATSFTASQTSIATSLVSSLSSRSTGSSRGGRSTRRRTTTTPAQEQADLGSDQTPETLVNSDMPSSPTSYSSNARPQSQAQSSQDPSSQDPSSPQSQPQSSSSGEPAHYPNLPPAYRPASVRSGRGEASGSTPSSGMRNAAVAAEKVASSGFYPAPATAEAEQAQAIAHRADAKAPIVVPPDEDEQRARHHVATDDKRELERLRLGGSAPPVARQDDNEAGPSAPHFEVDASGFETLPEEEEGPGPSRPSTSAPGIPLPPAPVQLKSLQTIGLEDHHSVVGSAPPRSPVDTPLTPTAPSAPPLDFDGEASAPPPAAAPLPSAPPLDYDEDTSNSSPATAPYTPSAPPLDDHDIDDTTSEAHGEVEHDTQPPTPPNNCADSDTDASDMRANLGVSGHRFLPRYEP